MPLNAFAKKTIIALACTTMLTMPAFANGHRDHGRDHRSGYSKQNHSNYSGRHQSSRHNDGYRNRSHYSGRSNYRDSYRGNGYRQDSHRGSVKNYRSHAPVYSRGYGAGYKPRYTYNPHKRVVYAPHFSNYRHYQPRFSVGYRLQPRYHVRINDYHRWGLYHPPHGHYWVRHNNDAYLAAAGTGLIAGIIIGALSTH